MRSTLIFSFIPILLWLVLVLFISLCMLRMLYWSHAVKKQNFPSGVYVGIAFRSFFMAQYSHRTHFLSSFFFQYFDWLKTFSQFVPSSRGGEKVQKRRERRRRKQKRQTKSNKKGNSWSVNSCWKTCWKYSLSWFQTLWKDLRDENFASYALHIRIYQCVYFHALCIHTYRIVSVCVHSSRAMNISDGISYVSRDWKSVRAIVSVPLCVRWILSWDQMN